MAMQEKNVFVPRDHGFFDDLVTMLVSLSSYMFAMHVSIASNKPKPFAERPLNEWISYILPIKSLEFPLSLEQNASDQEIIVFPAEILMHLSLDSWPQWIEYRIASKTEPQPDARLAAQGNRYVITRIIGASFTSYYSKAEPTIKARYGTDKDKWPETIRFAWIIRNSFAHGGKLNISDAALRPAAWNIWSFDHRKDGQNFLFEPGMLGIGDVITLMQDFDTYVRP
jgi:hypothetical protein